VLQNPIPVRWCGESDESGGLEAPHQVSVMGRYKAACDQPAAHVACHAFGVQHQILDQKGNAEKRRAAISGRRARSIAPITAFKVG